MVARSGGIETRTQASLTLEDITIQLSTVHVVGTVFLSLIQGLR